MEYQPLSFGEKRYEKMKRKGEKCKKGRRGKKKRKWEVKG
jgi:hypothetical protein